MIFTILVIVSLISRRMTESTTTDPPIPEEIPHVVNHFGIDLSDPFSYFSSDEYHEKVLKYIDEENEWAENNVYNTDLVDALKDELEKYMSPSLDRDKYISRFPEAGYEYYKVEALTGYGKWYRRNIETQDEEEVVLDETELFDLLGQPEFFHVTNLAPSPDHKMIAFLYDELGDERMNIGFRDLTTETFLSEKLEEAYYGLVWSEDSKRIMFERLLDLSNQPLTVYAYEIGKPSDDIVEVFRLEDRSFGLSLSLSSDHEYIFIATDSHHGTQHFYLPTSSFIDVYSDNNIREFPIPFTEDIEYYVEHSSIGFIVRKQNHYDSNFGVYLYSDDTIPELQLTIRPESTDMLVTDVYCFKSGLFIMGFDTNTIHPFVEVYEYSTSDGAFFVSEQPRQLDFSSLNEIGEKNYAISIYSQSTILGATGEYEESKLKFYYSSLITPKKVYEYDMFTDTFELIESIDIDSFDSSEYVDEVIFVPTTDGSNVEIPVSVCFKKMGTDENSVIVDVRDRPVYVYVYGSYGSIVKPFFRDYMIPLLERGFVYAIAHVRGSSIRGMKYYHDGYRHNKMNTFSDLNRVLEYFTETGIAFENGIAIEGRSAGGLTVGATTILFSDNHLMKVTLATVPFVDVVNTMLDESIPLTIMEEYEWGDALHNSEDFEYMLSYDPYYSLDTDNHDNYPDMYLEAGLNDNRVNFWEPLKIIAGLRTGSIEQKNTQVVRVSAGGHFGSSEGDEERIEKAEKFAFVIQSILGWDGGLIIDNNDDDDNIGIVMKFPMFFFTGSFYLVWSLVVFSCCFVCCILFTFYYCRDKDTRKEFFDQLKSTKKEKRVHGNFLESDDEEEEEEDFKEKKEIQKIYLDIFKGK